MSPQPRLSKSQSALTKVENPGAYPTDGFHKKTIAHNDGPVDVGLRDFSAEVETGSE
jgi:hypothetical protein